mgnify:CR=1 FL=1
MSDPVLLDASAALAYVKREPGGERVRASLPMAAINTVNLAEVVGRIERQGSDGVRLARKLRGLGVEVEEFTFEDALVAGQLEPGSRSRGLSLADRSCLAVAARTGRLVLTTDRGLAELAPESVRVELIRWPSAMR